MAQFYRAQIVSTGVQGSPYVTTLNFLLAGSTPAGISTAIQGLISGFATLVHQDLIMDWDGSLEIVESTDGQITGVTSATPRSAQGTLAGDMLPPATQGLLQWRTGVFQAGREVRGKTFVPALTEAAALGGQVAATTQTGLQNLITAMIAATNAELAIYSRKNGSIVPVNAGTVWNQFAVLRSRRD